MGLSLLGVRGQGEKLKGEEMGRGRKDEGEAWVEREMGEQAIIGKSP